MGEVINMVTKFKTKQLMNKKLTGREVASMMLNHTLREVLGMDTVFSEAEVRTAVAGLFNRKEEHTECKKWLELESVIRYMHAQANQHALSFSSDLNLLLFQWTNAKLVWLVDGNEDKWQEFVNAKHAQVEKLGVDPEFISSFSPISETGKNAPITKVIDCLYESAIGHLKCYMACVALHEIIYDLVKVDIFFFFRYREHSIKNTAKLFNLAYDELCTSEYLAKKYPGFPALLSENTLNHIDIDLYAPDSKKVADVRGNIEEAGVDELFQVCCDGLDFMVSE